MNITNTITKNVYPLNQIDSKKQYCSDSSVKSDLRTINLNNAPNSYYNQISFRGNK